MREKKKNRITIEVDVSLTSHRGGPSNFIKGIHDILPYNTSKCYFISSENIYPSKGKKNSNYYFIPYPKFNESIYNKWIKIKKVNKLILGPIFVPDFWGLFPNKNIWKEKRFSKILRQVKGIAVHSKRVRNYLFLFFEKYKDLDYSQQGDQILNLFNNTTKKIEILKYGNYTKEKMKYLANNTKFIIYFSFFDTGAIGLKEIQNYGVFAFSHQRDLIIHENTGFYVPELVNKDDMNQAFKIIIEKIENLTNLHPNTLSIAKINQEINKCQNSLNDLCQNIL